MKKFKIALPCKILFSIRRNFNHYGTDSFIKSDLYKEYSDTLSHWTSLEQLESDWGLIHDEKGNSKVPQIYKKVKYLYDLGVTEHKTIGKILKIPSYIINDLIDEYEQNIDVLDLEM